MSEQRTMHWELLAILFFRQQQILPGIVILNSVEKILDVKVERTVNACLPWHAIRAACMCMYGRQARGRQLSNADHN